MFQIQCIPAYNDNYYWLIWHKETRDAVVIDAGDEKPIIEAVEKLALNLQAILITHRHWDHVDGIVALKAQYPDATVYGPENENVAIPALQKPLSGGEQISPMPGLAMQVFDLAGHTAGHLGYYFPEHFFCGDTLFSCGCGRVFDGSKALLHQALQKIKVLPPQTWLHCAHEYTLDNIGFAQWVEPENPALPPFLQKVDALRADNRPSIPSKLAEELAVNPFLRTDVPQVKAAVENYLGKSVANEEALFAALRTWKDEVYDQR